MVDNHDFLYIFVIKTYFSDLTNFALCGFGKTAPQWSHPSPKLNELNTRANRTGHLRSLDGGLGQGRVHACVCACFMRSIDCRGLCLVCYDDLIKQLLQRWNRRRPTSTLRGCAIVAFAVLVYGETEMERVRERFSQRKSGKTQKKNVRTCAQL